MTQADNGGQGYLQRLAEQACAEQDLDRRRDLVHEIAYHGRDGRMKLIRQLMASGDEQAQMLAADVVTATPYYARQEARAWAKEQGWPGADVEPFTAADRDWLASELSYRLARIQDPDLVFAMVQAVGEQEFVSATDSVIRHSDDADADVREAAAVTLGALGSDRPAPDRVVQALLQLARDPVDDVRDWALFSLGRGATTPVDTPETRAVFEENLEHPDKDVQEEAIRALALLGDIENLEKALSNYDFDEDLVEAARRAANPRLQEPLQKLLAKEASSEPVDLETTQHVEAVMCRAIEACQPAGAEGG